VAASSSRRRKEGPALDRATGRALERAAPGSVSLRVEDRICYSFDATDLRSLPDAVAWPRTTREVSDVVHVATSAGLPVVPRGAGTGYTGGSVPVAGGVVVSLEKMNRIRSLDVSRQLAVVEPGVVNSALREKVEALGLFYPPDPASLLVSTIGGNIAEGAGGPRTVLHGTTRDYVVGLELVLSDGSVLSTGILSEHRIAWDAGPLIVASEGTIAVVTAAALRLSKRPESHETFWADFASLEDAAAAVARITASGLPVSVLELLDRDTYVCASRYVRGVSPDPAPDGSLLVELEGREDRVRASSDRLAELLTASGASRFRRASDEAERDEIWDIRRAISPSLARLSTGKINEDIAVPRSAIPAFVQSMREIAANAGLRVLAFGHAGDGNLHINIIVERADREQMAAARHAVGKLFEAALSLGGTLSGEHGIGITKADHLAEELDETALSVTATIKHALDPSGLVNPDKIITDRPNPWWKDLDSHSPDGGSCRC
jgi:glycolate oxidase